MLSIRSALTKAVLGHFMLNPDSESFVNDLARRFELDSGNLARQLVRLEREGVLKSRWSGSQRYYSLNKGFALLKEYRKIVLKTFGLEYSLKAALQKIDGISRAFVFGSYASDRMDVASDIDVMVVGDHSTAELNRAVAGIQEKTERPIHAVSMTAREYEKKRKTDPFLKSIEKGPRVNIV
jgi:predicted nucleotidyltransferase